MYCSKGSLWGKRVLQEPQGKAAGTVHGPKPSWLPIPEGICDPKVTPLSLAMSAPFLTASLDPLSRQVWHATELQLLIFSLCSSSLDYVAESKQYFTNGS